MYNTYGQLANWQLLHMYGFAEPYPNNHYDTVSSCISHVDSTEIDMVSFHVNL